MLFRLCVLVLLASCSGAATATRSEEDVETGAGGARDPRCLPQGGYADDACDRCENERCCEERFDCYDDATCGAAADTLDACIDRAQNGCWAEFAANGARARARFECARAHCAAACGVPR